MLKPIPLCPMEPRPADTWPGSLKDIRDRIDDHVNDRSDPHDTLERERVKEVVGTGAASVRGRGDGTVVVDVPDSLSGFRNDAGFVTSSHVWRQEDVAGLKSALSGISSALGVKADLVNGRVPASQIPSEFDEVLFYVSGTDFINGRGEFGKLYVDMACNRIYRWDATTFVELSSSDGVAADLSREIASVRKLLEGYAVKDHDHDGRYVPFTVEVLTDEWDVIPPEGHDASEYSTPWIKWGDVFGSGTESWEYSPGTNTPESISFDRDERGPLDVKLEIYNTETGNADLFDGQIVRRVVKARMFETSDGAVVLGANFPRASKEAYGAVKIGDGLKVVDGVVSSDAQPNVIETVKVNGKPLAVSGKSVDVTVPDAYSKPETDAMLNEKADKLGDWVVDPPEVRLVWVDADHPHPTAPSGVTGWWPDSQGSVKGDRDSTELHWAEGSEAPCEITAVRKHVLYTGDAQPNVIETVKVDGVPLHVSDDKSVDIRSTGMISDSAGNVIRADGSSVVMDGSWTCNGVLLTRKEGRDNYWENAERHWGLGYDSSAKWAFTNGSGHARSDAPADATSLSFVIDGVTYDATIGRADSVVMAGDVVPKGNGTETIATIGGKDIKAPASPVSSVNDKTGAVKLGAADVGALSLSSANKVGSSFSMDFEGEETSGGSLSFGVGMGPAGRTFIANKLYCSDRLYANGFVITNTSGAPGESVLARIQEYGGDYKTALGEVNGIVGAVAAYPMSTVVDGALKDRTVNHATAGGTFTFPARTGTNARDFVLVIDALETAPTVTFPGSFTYISEQDAADIWTAEAGKVNAWYFSEVADGVFMVCHKAMGAVAQ